MNSPKEVDERIRQLGALGDLSKAYAEISSNRMMKVRGVVVKTRDFLAQITEIFQEVRRSYRKEVLKLLKKRRGKKGENVTFLAHNGKTVAVFLSSNTGLYGEIVGKTFEMLSTEVVASPDVEVTIIGRLGRALFISRFPNKPYTYFELPDNYSEKQILIDVIKHIVQYEQIHIYYGKFHSVVSQKPEVYNISAETPITKESDIKEAGPLHKYIFEPTLQEILGFFETQMFTSMFEQAVNESSLSKHASRMLAMDRAFENITKELDQMKMTKLRINHDTSNRKQLALMSSMRLWKGVW